MPPKKNPETPEEQAKRFRKEARKLIKGGALDPKVGAKALEQIVTGAGRETRDSPE